MPLPGVITRTAEEVAKVREAFVERPVRPTLEELTEEFNVPRSTISKWSSDESWATLRAGHLEKKTLEGDALALLLEASKNVNRPIINSFTGVVIDILNGLSRTLADIDHSRAPSTRVDIYNTASFAMKNVADACKTIGVVSFTKGLADIGKEDNGRWNPGMLNQINLTVHNLVAKTESAIAEAKVEKPVEEPPKSPSQ